MQLRPLDPAQIEPLAAREHRHRHLAHLGRGEDEDRLRRRLLQGLEQAVEGLLREHVHFVDDVDLVARRGRRVAHAVDDLADVVDAGAGRGVHLEHVDVAALGDRDAGLADAAGLGRRLALAVGADAVQGTGDDPRRAGLADAADAGQQERVRDPPGAQRIAQRAHQRVLADQLGQALRPVPARQHPVELGGGRRGCCRAGLVAGRDCPASSMTTVSGRREGEGSWRGDPVVNSLRLLPSGPDRVGERTVRRQLPRSISVVRAASASRAMSPRARARGWWQPADRLEWACRPCRIRSLDAASRQSTAACLRRSGPRSGGQAPPRCGLARGQARRSEHPRAPDVEARAAWSPTPASRPAPCCRRSPSSAGRCRTTRCSWAPTPARCLFAAELGIVPPGGRYVELRSVGATLSAREAGLCAYARGLAFWHARNRYCGVCGAPTRSEQGGHVRRCTACDAQHFPRSDPAVIVLVTHRDPQARRALPARPLGALSARPVLDARGLRRARRIAGGGGAPRGPRGGRARAVRDRLPQLAALAVPGLADAGLSGARAARRARDRSRRAGRCRLVHQGRAARSGAAAGQAAEPGFDRPAPDRGLARRSTPEGVRRALSESPPHVPHSAMRRALSSSAIVTKFCCRVLAVAACMYMSGSVAQSV